MFSKSQYTKYKSCPKKLWLTRNKKEALSPLGEAAQKSMATGQQIGQLAWKRFPNGVWVENGYQNPQQAVLRTQELMKKGVPYIYEAAFIYNDILVFVDILEKVPNGWNIIEVKSSFKLSLLFGQLGYVPRVFFLTSIRLQNIYSLDRKII